MPEESTTTETTTTAAGTQETGATTESQTQERTFSQADLDRVVQDRLARERQKFADYDELKTRADRLTEIEDANKSEVERARESVAAAEARARAAEIDAQEIRVRSAIVAEAARKGVVDPDAAVALLDRSTLDFGDDGVPTNIAAAMDSLLATKTYLVGGGTRMSADQGARGGRTMASEDALRLLETNPAKFDELVRSGEIPKNIFG